MAENNEEGVTIWHIKESSWSDVAEVELSNFGTNIKFGLYNRAENFNDYTYPSSKLRGGEALSDIAINNILAKPSSSSPPASQYGELNFEDPTPKKPTNLNLSGIVGQNPTITWSSSNEPDISHYVVKKRYVWNSGGTTTHYSNTTSKQFTDYNVVINRFGDLTAYYSVKTVDAGGNESNYSIEVSTDGQSSWKMDEKLNDEINSITSYDLKQNYPNPFNPSTSISYQLPKSGHVMLNVYNSLGEVVTELVNSHRESGAYKIQFDGTHLPSGMYFFRLQSRDYIQIYKMLLVK